jgi:hypothetical protein
MNSVCFLHEILRTKAKAVLRMTALRNQDDSSPFQDGRHPKPVLTSIKNTKKSHLAMAFLFDWKLKKLLFLAFLVIRTIHIEQIA